MVYGIGPCSFYCTCMMLAGNEKLWFDFLITAFACEDNDDDYYLVFRCEY